MKLGKKLFLASLITLATVPAALPVDNPVSHVALAEEHYYPLKHTDRAPHNIVGKIVFADGSHATGFVIGNNTIATNRHVAKDYANGVAAYFRLGLNRHNTGKFLLGEYDVVGVKFAPNPKDDVAILIVQPRKGSASLNKVVTPAKLVNANYITEQWLTTDRNQVHTAGYPGKKMNEVMWGSDGKIVNFGTGIHTYVATTTSVPGSSGSPLFNRNNEVIGVNSRHFNDAEYHSGGYLFKNDLYEFIIINR